MDVVAIFGVGCAVPMQYYNQLTVYFAMPILGLAGIWIWYLINRFVKGADPEESLDGAWNTVQTFLFMVTVTVAVTITATITVSITVHYHLSHLLSLPSQIYPTTASVMLNAYNCREILGKYYLVQDLASPCYDAEWGQYAILATVGVMLYPLGILLYSFLILRRNRHKLYISRKLKRRYGMLYARYEQQYYYWVTSRPAAACLAPSLNGMQLTRTAPCNSRSSLRWHASCCYAR